MSTQIIKFMDRLTALRLKQSKDFVWAMKDAEDLNKEITKILLELNELKSIPKDKTDISVVIDGKGFENSA